MRIDSAIISNAPNVEPILAPATFAFSLELHGGGAVARAPDCTLSIFAGGGDGRVRGGGDGGGLLGGGLFGGGEGGGLFGGGGEGDGGAGGVGGGGVGAGGLGGGGLGGGGLGGGGLGGGGRGGGGLGGGGLGGGGLGGGGLGGGGGDGCSLVHIAIRRLAQLLSELYCTNLQGSAVAVPNKTAVILTDTYCGVEYAEGTWL